ncbi:MAG: DUF1244 domain-containing protein [Rhodospirillales bacterium]|nr:DUF1244 domain-containing protein [Rhodospirillales bacterium]
MDAKTQVELEAAAFRGLVAHLQQRSDVQNIDLMNLAGFCRNCLAKWLLAAAKAHGLAMTYEDARTAVYGEPFTDWKAKHQEPATAEQLRRFEETKPRHAVIPGT